MLNFTRRGLQFRAERHSCQGRHEEAIAIYKHLIRHSHAPEVFNYQVAIADECAKLRYYFIALEDYENAISGFRCYGRLSDVERVKVKLSELIETQRKSLEILIASNES